MYKRQSEPVEGADEPDTNAPRSQKGRPSIREAVREAGGNVGNVRMPELKRYLQQALDEEGPGSNKGEVELKRSLLSYLRCRDP